VSFTLEQLLEKSLLGIGPHEHSVDDAEGVDAAPALRLVHGADARAARAGRPLARVGRDGAVVDGAFGDDTPRQYRLYAPVSSEGGERSLVVMLHGAGQDHLDFARGTAMHDHRAAADTFVLYPGQSTTVPGRCWNWFREGDQSRGEGEPALIAALTRSIVARYDISPRRVYVAGMSAGAAMAVVMGNAYPDVYAAVGVHSGLPYCAASDMYAALELMARGPSKPQRKRRGAAVPTIVFQGDADRTVHPANAAAIVADALECCAKHAAPKAVSTTLDADAYTATTYPDAKGRACVEHWTLHGAGHAWSGGSLGGSHTDPHGPDATGEMLRFFASHRLEPRCTQ